MSHGESTVDCLLTPVEKSSHTKLPARVEIKVSQQQFVYESVPRNYNYGTVVSIKQTNWLGFSNIS